MVSAQITVPTASSGQNAGKIKGGYPRNCKCANYNDFRYIQDICINSDKYSGSNTTDLVAFSFQAFTQDTDTLNCGVPNPFVQINNAYQIWDC